MQREHFAESCFCKHLLVHQVQTEEGSDALLSGQLTLLDLLVLSDMFSFLFNRKDVKHFYFAIAKTITQRQWSVDIKAMGMAVAPGLLGDIESSFSAAKFSNTFFLIKKANTLSFISSILL